MTRSKKLGAEYVAVKCLYDHDGNVLADAGDTCERVNPSSLEWLLEQGAIRLRERHGRTRVEEE